MNRLVVYGSIVALLASAAAGYYYGVKSTESKIAIVEKEVVKKDVVTRIVEITRPDGTIEKDTTIVDNTKEKRDTKVVETKATPPKLNKVSATANTENFREIHSYTITYERRLLQSLWVGASYNTKQIYGVTLGLEF